MNISNSTATALRFVVMLSSAARFSVTSFVARSRPTIAFQAARTISQSSSAMLAAADGQAEVVLVGCGAPNRGYVLFGKEVEEEKLCVLLSTTHLLFTLCVCFRMGWYHAVQMLDKK